MKKICGVCKQEKDISCFGLHKQTQDGYRFECFGCRKENYYLNHAKNLEQRRNDYQKHKESRLEKCKEIYQNNREKIKERVANYYYNNTEKIKQQRKEYRERNKEKIAERKREYYFKKKSQEPPLIKEILPEGLKRCNKCLKIKPFDCYGFHDKEHTIRFGHCLECEKIKRRKYYLEKKQILSEKDKIYRLNNKEKIKIRKKNYRNSEHGRELTKKHKKKEYIKNWQNPTFRVVSRIKSRLR